MIPAHKANEIIQAISNITTATIKKSNPTSNSAMATPDECQCYYFVQGVGMMRYNIDDEGDIEMGIPPIRTTTKNNKMDTDHCWNVRKWAEESFNAILFPNNDLSTPLSFCGL